MKDKILQAIKATLGKTMSSINDKTLNAYVNLIADQITDESEISEAIKPYVEVLKEFQGNINSVAAAAATTKEKELKEAEERAKAEAAAQKAGGKGETDNEEPEWFKTFREQQEKRLSAIEKEKTTATRKQRLEEIAKDAGILGAKTLKDFSRMNFDSDEAFEEYLEETRADLESAKQEEADQGLSGSSRPGGGKGGVSKKEPSKEELDFALGNV